MREDAPLRGNQAFLAGQGNFPGSFNSLAPIVPMTSDGGLRRDAAVPAAGWEVSRLLGDGQARCLPTSRWDAGGTCARGAPLHVLGRKPREEN